MKNVIIFIRCFWANYLLRASLFLLLLIILSLVFRLTILGIFFSIDFIICVVLTKLGIYTFKMYKKSWKKISRGWTNLASTKHYCEDEGAALAIKDFKKIVPDAQIKIRDAWSKKPKFDPNDLSFKR